MEHPRGLDQHHLDLLLETHETDVVERPVPVVVVKVAEVGAAGAHLLPQLPREGHAHVVLGGHPQGHVHLQMYGGDRQATRVEVELNCMQKTTTESPKNASPRLRERSHASRGRISHPRKNHIEGPVHA